MRLPITTRHRIAEAFGIQKKGATEVANNEVVKDGYIVGDIDSALSKVKMQNYTGVITNDDAELWNAVVAVAEGRARPMLIADPVDITSLKNIEPGTIVQIPTTSEVKIESVVQTSPELIVPGSTISIEAIDEPVTPAVETHSPTPPSPVMGITPPELKASSLEEVMAESSKTPEFQKAYAEEKEKIEKKRLGRPPGKKKRA